MKKEKVVRGVALLVSLIFAVVLGIGAVAVTKLHSTEIRLVRRQNNSTHAFYLAEAGLQGALSELHQDFMVKTADPNWPSEEINGITVINDMLFDQVTLGGGSYSVELVDMPGKKVKVKSTGTYRDSTRTVTATVTAYDPSPWNNAIFGGSGMGGGLITGNVGLHGSVLILGIGLTPGDYALSMSGNADIRNNYEGISDALSSRIPACPTTTFNEEEVYSLGAILMVKQGLVGLSGSATIGSPDNPGDSYKETMDGVYVTDGYGGNKGADSIYSDNGTENDYDLSDAITFPSLSDSYGDYSGYLAYAKDKGLVISDETKLAELANITPESEFSYSDEEGAIAIDGSGNLTISGIVYIEGGDLAMSGGTIIYSGSGIIVVEGDGTDEDVRIHTSLLTAGTFPTSHVLGVVTPGKIEFDTANIDVMGAFYAETEIEVKKQTDIAGTLVSNHIDMGSQVPSIYQVPTLVDNLPSGMIDSSEPPSVIMSNWQEE